MGNGSAIKGQREVSHGEDIFWLSTVWKAMVRLYYNRVRFYRWVNGETGYRGSLLFLTVCESTITSNF